jgi:hypothetical protein
MNFVMKSLIFFVEFNFYTEVVSVVKQYFVSLKSLMVETENPCALSPEAYYVNVWSSNSIFDILLHSAFPWDIRKTTLQHIITTSCKLSEVKNLHSYWKNLL